MRVSPKIRNYRVALQSHRIRSFRERIAKKKKDIESADCPSETWRSYPDAYSAAVTTATESDSRFRWHLNRETEKAHTKEGSSNLSQHIEVLRI